VVKCKWEQDLSPCLEDGDCNHLTPGGQFLPPCEYQGKKTIQYWAVVTDEEDRGNVYTVYVDVYHPNGSFKYEVIMTKQPKECAIEAFQDAYEAGLITFAEGYTYEEVLDELNECLAQVWMGEADLDYHQMAGDYRVEAYAIDTNNNRSAPLINTFLYVPCACCEFDFTTVNYGSVNVCTFKWIGGDNVFGTSDKPTVRNIGNVPCQIVVEQDDMGFGKDVSGNWNVEFGARLGWDGVSVYYDPYEEVVLPDVLPNCNTQKLDFGIHVKKAGGGEQYTGKMWLGCWPDSAGKCGGTTWRPPDWQCLEAWAGGASACLPENPDIPSTSVGWCLLEIWTENTFSRVLWRLLELSAIATGDTDLPGASMEWRQTDAWGGGVQVITEVVSPGSYGAPVTQSFGSGMTEPQTTLVVETLPIRAGVYVDNIYWGESPQTREVEEGAHTVIFGDYPGYLNPPPQTLAITRGEVRTVTGIYTEIQEELIESESSPILLPFLSADESVNIELEGTAVTQITIGVRRGVENVRLMVQQLTGSPAGLVLGPPGVVYRYLNIVAENLIEPYIETVLITFRVEKSWAEGANIDPTTVTLWRWDPSGGSWEPTLTVMTGEDSAWYFYRAESSWLSLFLILGFSTDLTSLAMPESPGIIVVVLLAGTFATALVAVSIMGGLVRRGILAHWIRGTKARGRSPVQRMRRWILAWMVYFVRRMRTRGLLAPITGVSRY